MGHIEVPKLSWLVLVIWTSDRNYDISLASYSNIRPYKLKYREQPVFTCSSRNSSHCPDLRQIKIGSKPHKTHRAHRHGNETKQVGRPTKMKQLTTKNMHCCNCCCNMLCCHVLQHGTPWHVSLQLGQSHGNAPNLAIQSTILRINIISEQQ